MVRQSLVVLLVATLVVVAVLAGSTILAEPSDPPKEYPEYEVSSLVPERLAAEGTVPVEPAGERGIVLIDRGHGNRFEPGEIESLTAAISAAGYEVRYYGPGDSLSDALSEAEAFVVIDPAQRYTDAQLDRLEWFVGAGGRLLLFGEPTQSASEGLSASTNAAPNMLDHVATRFGFDVGESYLYNMDESDGNYRNVLGRSTGNGDVVAGVDRVATYTATSVSAAGGVPLLVAGEGTRSARDDATGPHALAVRKGDVLAVGDSTFLRGGNYRVLDNEVLIGGLVRFLVSGDRERSVFDYPGILGDAPTVRYTSVDLLGAAQTAGADLRESGRLPRLSLERGQVDPDGTDVLLTTFDRLRELEGVRSGITVRDNGIALGSYRGGTGDVAIVTDTNGPIDVLIVADSPDRAEFATDLLVEHLLFRHATGNSTAVVT